MKLCRMNNEVPAVAQYEEILMIDKFENRSSSYDICKKEVLGHNPKTSWFLIK